MVTKNAFMKAVLDGVRKGGKGAAKFFGETAAKNVGTLGGDAARHAGGAAKWVANNPGASLGIAGAGAGGYLMGKSGASKNTFMKAVLKGVRKGGKGAANFFGEVSAENFGTLGGDAARQAALAANWVANNPGTSLGIAGAGAGIAGAGAGWYLMDKSGASKEVEDADDVLRELRQEKIGMQTTIGWK